MSSNRRVGVCTAIVIGCLLIAETAAGQYPPSHGVYDQTGNRFPTSIQIPSATYATPSEVRMAIHASGATPSELRTNYDRIGPLAPSGPIAYVPPRFNVYAKPATAMPVYICAPGDAIAINPVPARSLGAISPLPNQFSTGAFYGSSRCWLLASPAFERWMSSGSSLSTSRSFIGPPSSFSRAVLESPRPGFAQSLP